ncbi:hypothetical protein [Microbacterium sp. SORGH_AS_0421]|uniref:hypothetical protein n=1 Tax=Microbacterium sp. SORGH_AS_0421 TaxID=3041768 RepID=UPI0027D7CE92|nr:hypothetical protein [Microbacterium sp. SORGH_AS_0421]
MSADIFGRGCRLPVALWILRRQQPRFYQSEPPASLGAPTAVRQELERLARAGLLEVEKSDRENRVYYSRTASPLWRVFAEAADVIDGERG